VPNGNLLGHIVCREGVLVEPAKVVVIVKMMPPTSAKKLSLHVGAHRVLSQIYHKICKHYCTSGEPTKEVKSVPVDPKV
jgi:hypothetical protein